MTELAPPRFEQGRAMLLAGIRRHHEYSTSAHSIPEQWRQFEELESIPGQKGTTAYPEKQIFEYMCGVEVTDFEQLPVDLGRMRIPVQHYAVFTHTGHVSALRATWDAIWNGWLPGSGYQPANTPDFELYDERFDPDTESGTIEIWFPVET